MSSSVQKVSVKSKTHSKSIHSIFRKSILFLNLLVPVPFLILRFFKISIKSPFGVVRILDPPAFQPIDKAKLIFFIFQRARKACNAKRRIGSTVDI